MSPRAATPAIEIVVRAGLPHRVLEYVLPERHGRDRGARPDYGREAAAALGVDPDTVCKTLVVSADGELALAVVPVAGDLDLKAVGAALGSRRAELADPTVAERATGGVVGGISPLGSRRPLRVVVDAAVLELSLVLVSAGRRGLQLELAPADLVRLTGAIVARVRRG